MDRNDVAPASSRETPRGAPAGSATSTDRNKLQALASAHVVSMAIYCAAELCVADALSEGPKSAEELASRLGCSADHLRRLLIALSSMGIFRCRAGKIEQTALSTLLRRDCVDSAWPVVSFFGSEMYKAIGGLLTTVRTGSPSWNEEFGISIWEYLAEHRDRGAVFDSVMSKTSEADLPAILTAYDFSRHQVIVDVGGGDGYVLMGILENHPQTKGVLFDLDQNVARATALRSDHSARSRCEFVAGDFFEFIPTGDALILRRVLHDWNDEDAVRILRRSRAAVSAGGKVLVIEQALATTRLDARALWSDVSMMAFGGRERTVAEYGDLLTAAGLVLERVIDTSFGAVLVGTCCVR